MTTSGRGNPNNRLRRQRELRGWTQKNVADRIDTDSKIVGKWERGEITPSPYSRQKLCELFDKNAEELGFLSDEPQQGQVQSPGGVAAPFTSIALPSNAPMASVLFWNIPYRRNSFFIGREDILARLHDSLTSHKVEASIHAQAISGLGGIGKTQTAIEYAYRYCADYQTILWARADTHDLLVSDFVSIAALLKLPEKDEQDQSLSVNALKRWLQEHDRWLLILDNADEPHILRDFLPQTGNGHILLTTRQHIIRESARPIELEQMTFEEGMRFLLQRAGIMEVGTPLDEISRANRVAAQEIVQAMDGLPLALDQAGAYILTTVCGLSGYLERFKQQRARLLQMRGPATADDHPASVATTWSLSFEKVQQVNPAAAELLQFCAFLHPDAIPEEILTKGVSELGSILAPVAADLIDLDMAISELRKYSLVRRDPEIQILNIHRLVQAVLKDAMDKSTQHQWVVRAVQAINLTFPEAEFANWNLCQRCLPHALICAELIKQWNIISPQAAELLDRAGQYLADRAQYAQAESLLQQALALHELIVGSEHPDVAQTLNNLADLYYEQGSYSQGEPLIRRALSIWQQSLGPEHSLVATCLNSLASLCQDQGKYDEAEPFFLQALAIREKTLGPIHRDVADSLNCLAIFYYRRGNYAQAEAFFQRAVVMFEKILGPEHPEVATCLNNLGWLYVKHDRYLLAESLLERALTIREKTLGSEHPFFASTLNNLSQAYMYQEKYSQAEQLQLQSTTRKANINKPKMHINSLSPYAKKYWNPITLLPLKASIILANSIINKANIFWRNPSCGER